MKFLFSILILLTGLNGNCQTYESKIIGRWKIISLNDRDVYYNFKTDSAILKGIDPTNKQDNVTGIQNLRQTMAFMKNTFYDFDKKGNLKIIGQDSSQKIKYKIEKLKGKTKLTFNRIGDTFVDSFYVTIKKNILILKSTDDADFNLVFEKD